MSDGRMVGGVVFCDDDAANAYPIDWCTLGAEMGWWDEIRMDWFWYKKFFQSHVINHFPINHQHGRTLCIQVSPPTTRRRFDFPDSV